MFGSRRPFGLGLVRPSPIRKHTPFEEWDQLSARKPNSPGIALSVLLHDAPGQAVVVARNDYVSNRPFDPSCGTVPRLEGFAWR